MYKHRASPRASTSLQATIVVSDKAPGISCRVRNLSEGGACLETATTVGIPSTFAIVVENKHRACRVIWRTDTGLGVTFRADARAPVRPDSSSDKAS
jgi:hypothetical protein